MSGKTKAELLAENQELHERVKELEYQLVLRDAVIEGRDERLEREADISKKLERVIGDKLPKAKLGENAGKGRETAKENKNKRWELLVENFMYYRTTGEMSLSDARDKANKDVIEEYGNNKFKGYSKRTLDKLTDKLIR